MYRSASESWRGGGPALFISYRSLQRPKRCPEFGGKERGLLPGRKVTALVELVVVDQLGNLARERTAMEIDLGRVLDVLPAMVWTALPDGQVDFVNRRWSEYTGLSLDEAHGWEWKAAVNADDLPKLTERWRSILASGEPGEMEARVRRFDGQYRRYAVHCSPMCDDVGRIHKWYGVATDVEDVRQAEEILRRRELDFQLIVNNIPVPVAVTTPSGEIEGLNQPNLDYSGKTFEEIKGWKTSNLIHPDDLEQTIATQVEAHQKGIAYNVESRHRRADGVYRWYNVLGLPLRDPQGRILRWFLLLIDIDERKRAEEALRQSEARLVAAERDLRLTIDTIPVFVAAYQPDGTRSFVNRIWQDYMGLTLEEVTGPGATTFPYFHPADVERNDKAWRASLASGEPLSIEVRVRRADGRYRWHSMRRVPLRNEKGDIVQWYAVGVDIEDQKCAEEALAASERNLKLIIDTIPALAWSARTDGSAEFFNQHYLTYIGLSAEQAQGWGWTVAVHPDDLSGLAATWQAALALEASGEAEARIRRFDGEYRWFLFRVDPLRDEAGTIVKWYGANTDIEDRKRAEDELRRSESFLADAQRLSRTGSFSWRVATEEVEWSEETYRIYEFDPVVPVTFDLIRSRVHPENLPSLQEVIDRARREGGDFDYETRLLMPDRSVKYLHMVAHSNRNKDGELEVRGAVQEVTERHLADEALSKARSELAHVARVSSLGALTASIAHEVNQPLSGIITNASTCLRMLAADPPNIDGAHETARRTIRDGNRAARCDHAIAHTVQQEDRHDRTDGYERGCARGDCPGAW